MNIVAIAGGSGSGKTTFGRALRAALGPAVCVLLEQDAYYRDRHLEFDHDGGAVNFDHPASIEFELLAAHLQLLGEGRATEVPQYDFVTHRRRTETTRVEPRPVVLVDGILLLVPEDVRARFTHKFFIDTPEAIRFARRLKRDTTERGRTEAGVREQFRSQVKPMHDQFVEPTKVFADQIIDGTQPFAEVIALVARALLQSPG